MCLHYCNQNLGYKKRDLILKRYSQHTLNIGSLCRCCERDRCTCVLKVIQEPAPSPPWVFLSNSKELPGCDAPITRWSNNKTETLDKLHTWFPKLWFKRHFIILYSRRGLGLVTTPTYLVSRASYVHTISWCNPQWSQAKLWCRQVFHLQWMTLIARNWYELCSLLVTVFVSVIFVLVELTIER